MATLKRRIGEPWMQWREIDKDALPLHTITAASIYYQQKYGEIPTRVELPSHWADAIEEIESEFTGLQASVNETLLPRHIALTHISANGNGEPK